MKKFILVVLMVLAASTMHAYDQHMQNALDYTKGAMYMVQTWQQTGNGLGVLDWVGYDLQYALGEINQSSIYDKFATSYCINTTIANIHNWHFDAATWFSIVRYNDLNSVAFGITDSLYRKILNRPMDTDYWANTLVSGENTVDSVAYYLSVAEVYCLYSVYFHRAPSQERLNYWVWGLTSGAFSGADLEWLVPMGN